MPIITPLKRDVCFDVPTLGQVFTPTPLVERMLGLVRNHTRPGWRVLEPSCGDGAFFRRIPGCVGVEVDPRHCPPGALRMDFFDFEDSAGFDTIIGNPPFVRHQDILPSTKARLDMGRFDGRSNLYLFFIDRCLSLLRPGGELIFVNPREFLKSTSARHLNARLWEEGTITDICDLGDARVFAGYAPNCVIWRFEKGNFSRRTSTGARLSLHEGQVVCTHTDYPYRLADFGRVKVGAASGADRLFLAPPGQGQEFVCSKTAEDGRTRPMWYSHACAAPPDALLPHKAALMARRIRPFGEHNWWQWGRGVPEGAAGPRIYVNAKTRRTRPFFVHPSSYFDGSVFAIVLDNPETDPHRFAAALNAVDWDELGFKSGGRLLLQQRSLEHAPLPEAFGEFLDT